MLYLQASDGLFFNKYSIKIFLPGVRHGWKIHGEEKNRSALVATLTERMYQFLARRHLGAKGVAPGF